MLEISYTLTIDDAPASAELIAAIREVEVEDHADMADMLRLRLAVAVQENGERWAVIDESLFERLTKLRLSVNVGSGAAQPLIEAYVIDTRSDLSYEPGGSTLEVVAMDGFTGFKTATTEELPTATAVMDPFHVVRLGGDALDRCRRRVQLNTCGHRGHKGDPLYAARRTLHTNDKEC